MLQSVLTKLIKSGVKTPVKTRNCASTVKDLYKSYNHNMKKYDEYEQEEILEFVNGAKNVEDLHLYIPKNKSTKIFKHLVNNGPFQVVENFLDVKGIQVPQVEKFCDKILSDEDPESTAQANKIKRLKNRTVPKLSKDDSFNLSNLNIVGFTFDLRGMAYAHITNKVLKSSKYWQPETPLINKSAFEHHNLG